MSLSIMAFGMITFSNMNIQYDDIQHNNIQHNCFKQYDIQHNIKTASTEHYSCRNSEFLYTDRGFVVCPCAQYDCNYTESHGTKKQATMI